ncbi:PREDICTED: putative fatty acyl-CoA reductase CG5065 [Drosophila arizonae]|uniref:Fatty acyl-CoA reductase n=1 Tax=Drosophila arizonae TaxID=7263 RepID=A0ABM1PD05_DROAR|nr:PREDICTED: putative fatty acyl-CoA reductase CG5065 [Drosophila arizonae]
MCTCSSVESVKRGLRKSQKKKKTKTQHHKYTEKINPNTKIATSSEFGLFSNSMNTFKTLTNHTHSHSYSTHKHPHPHTHTPHFTHILLAFGYHPAAIMQTGLLVSPAAYEPLQGWVDNLNGPTGLMIGCGKGVIRSVLVNKDNKAEVIPVDYAINGLIVIPYEFNKQAKRPADVPVYNITNADFRKKAMGEIVEISKRINKEIPFNAGLWYPDPCVTTNEVYHKFNVAMFHWLPAYLIDFLMLILGQKRFMVRVQTKISVGLEVLQFFTTRSWDFKSTHFQQIYKDISEADRKIFKINTDDVDDYEYLKTSILGGRQYVMKEPMTSLPRSRIQLRFLYVLDRVCKTVILCGLFYWTSMKLGLIDLVRYGISTVKH